MPARFMLDADTCIHIRSRLAPGTLKRFSALGAGDAVMSVVTYGELRLGTERSPSRGKALRVLAELVGVVRVEPLSMQAAEEYGVIRADLQRRGEIIGGNDLWIAAHARSLSLTLVTGNDREFRRVPGLSVENWVSEAG